VVVCLSVDRNGHVLRPIENPQVEEPGFRSEMEVVNESRWRFFRACSDSVEVPRCRIPEMMLTRANLSL
jgi:hypothetical protein